jgi:hypothetical protein
MPGLVEVAAGIGSYRRERSTIGIDDDDDEKRNTVSFLVLHDLHSTFVVANPFHIFTYVQTGDCAHFLSPALCWTEYYIEHGCDVYLFQLC